MDCRGNERVREVCEAGAKYLVVRSIYGAKEIVQRVIYRTESCSHVKGMNCQNEISSEGGKGRIFV